MNQTHSTNSKVSINSVHYINALESNLIQITRALAIEHNVRPDPEAKNMARLAAQDKVNLLLSDEDKDNVRRLWEETIAQLKTIKSKNDAVGNYISDVYELMKMMGLNNV